MKFRLIGESAISLDYILLGATTGSALSAIPVWSVLEIKIK